MPADLIPGKSFIEVQFPVSKISMESYKERKSQQFQTLTQLGKWWGPKPLILARAAILGLIFPATTNPTKDREIFLKLLTMDEEGLKRRKKVNIPLKEIASHLSQKEFEEFFDVSSTNRLRLRLGLPRNKRELLQDIVFNRMNYKQKISYCVRPEEIEGLSEDTWEEINKHLGTHAKSFQDLVKELGLRQYGSIPKVGDCFCGRGNIPFEAARLGCDAYASDINPVASLIAWAAFNVIGGKGDVISKLSKFHQRVYDIVDKQIAEWGIERSEEGWRSYAFLYCNETQCPECKWKIPLLSSFAIAERMQFVGIELIPNIEGKKFDICVKSIENKDEIEVARKNGTIKESLIYCPNPSCPAHSAPLSLDVIRQEGEGGLRLWDIDDIIPRPNDIFQERLYCIRWRETKFDNNGNEEIKWHFRSPTEYDLKNEERVLNLLYERISRWKQLGLIPTSKIEFGEKTGELIRTRGWTHWIHLFTPRQLLYHGLINDIARDLAADNEQKVSQLLGIGKCINFNSKLCHWNPSVDLPLDVFYNQALNPMYIYGERGIELLSQAWLLSLKSSPISTNYLIKSEDARINQEKCTFWITDPPYADAINCRVPQLMSILLTEFLSAR